MCRQLTINGVQVSKSKNSHGATWGFHSGSPQPALEAEEHDSTEKSHQENQQQEPDAKKEQRRSELECAESLGIPAASWKGDKRSRRQGARNL